MPDPHYDPDVFRHREMTEKVIGVFYDVYNELGFGFLESVYQESLAIALEEAGFVVGRLVRLPVWFRGRKVGDFVADIIVNGLVVLELKAVDALAGVHESQLLNYLKATEIEVGLLLNFGPKPQVKRRAFANNRKRLRPKIEHEMEQPHDEDDEDTIKTKS
ncbi:MAG: GxxExxY protein [Gemmataceae bacterium]|nr:GxxExxY protein [Planctomycetia bacterium]MBX3397924.1 GxxExxY protein [Gemmataceae bacterium]